LRFRRSWPVAEKALAQLRTAGVGAYPTRAINNIAVPA
jgi:hypothetical protein